jgi:capsular exopolysaccharide synthesis family protein
VDLAQVLKVVRRRWVAVIVTIAVALGAGWASTQLISTKSPPRPYKATALLGVSALTSEEPVRLATIAALAGAGVVPGRVAAEVGYEGGVQKMMKQINLTPDEEAGVIRITATSTDRTEALTLADTYGRQVIRWLDDTATETASGQIRILNDELAELEREIDRLEPLAAAQFNNSSLQADLEALDAEYRAKLALRQQYEDQVSAGTGQLIKYNPSTVVRASKAGIIDVRSVPVRLILAGLLGLIGGLMIAILLDRLDNKIRTKGEAERKTNLPVLAEIPVVRQWKNSDGGIAVAMTPKSPEADAFRLLAAALTRRPPQAPQTILVTSPGPSEGKTTVTANLAATFAEVGKKVIVLSADLHRPRIHVLFGVPNMSGLTEALESPSDDGPLLTQKNWRTSIDRVHLVPSGSSPENPGELLSSPNMRNVLEEAREVADIVLLDTPPILAASDSAQLLSEVDAVLLVIRGDKTLESSAEKTAELLRGLNVPVVGAVLNEAAEASAPRSYYDYYAEPNGRPASRRSVRPLLTRMRGGG